MEPVTPASASESAGAGRVLLRDARAGRWLLFRQPREIVAATTPAEVLPAVERAEARVARDGLWAAGFVSYEAAPGFDAALRVRPDASGFPLLWLALCPPPEDAPDPGLDAAPATSPVDWQPDMAPDGYRRSFARVKAYIRAGDTYQVNLSVRLRSRLAGDPAPLFARLLAAQPGGYGALVDAGPWRICSASPELFFTLDGDRIESRPMKGTAPRGLTFEQDEARAAELRASDKNRAENVMIVDMVRNDLGRVAEPGSVRAAELFAVERYPTLWQMTSTVEARTSAPLRDILRAAFPPASITGAPKARTVEIIAELESSPRRIYTGAIGFLAPGRRAQFNVAIRTLLVDGRTGEAEYGAGGGVVWDSACAAEQDEWRTKAEILTRAPVRFSLLESIRWTPSEGYHLLESHLARLARSAAYFGIPLRADAARARLAAEAAAFRDARKVRLLVDGAGAVACEPAPLGEPWTEPRQVRLAQRPIDPSNPFLYHKTTHRTVYDEARAGWPDADDVILHTPDGFVTESTIANVVAELDGELCTPPVACGLLPGTERAQLLERGVVVERPIRIEALRQCPRLFLVNSVRGMVPARLL